MKIEAIATRFVNIDTRLKAQQFLWDYADDIRPSCRSVQRLQFLKNSLRDAWGRRAADGPLFSEDIIEAIFFESTAKVINGRVCRVDEGKVGRPAFKARIGRAQPVFERRDVLDDIAYTILKASAHGRLRQCKGSKQGWRCPTPYLVADEKRRAYCYMGCGDEAKRLAKARWWAGNKAQVNRRRRAA